MRIALAVLLLGCACGRRPSDPAVAGPTGRSDAQGTLQGQPFSAADSLSYQTDGALTLWISSFAGACGQASQNAGVRNATVLVLQLQGPRPGALQLGEYPFGAPAGGRAARVAALRTDETCSASAVSLGGAEGSVTLTRIGPGGASGTFELRSGNDHLSGAFEGVACPAAPLSARAPATSCR
jgi:hypothetical protein